MFDRRLIVTVLILAVSVIRTAAQDPQMPPMPTPEVGVITINSEPLAISTELPGRLNAVRTADVRARATGILPRRAGPAVQACGCKRRGATTGCQGQVNALL